jgi:predicted DNA-binding transcriptional regulator AlpA
MLQENQIIITEKQSIQDIIDNAVSNAFERHSKKNAIEQPPPTENNDDDYFDVDGLCKFTHFAKATIYDYVAKKKIPYYKINRRLLFSKKEIMQFIQDSRHKSSDELEKDVDEFNKS